MPFQKYNSCLETLDLSKNPCCGPGLEGVSQNLIAFWGYLKLSLLGSISSNGVHVKQCAEAIVPIINVIGVCWCDRIGRVPSRIDVIVTSRPYDEHARLGRCDGIELRTEGEPHDALLGFEYPTC